MARTVKNGATPKRVVKKEESTILLVKELSDFEVHAEEVHLIYEITFSVTPSTGKLYPIHKKRLYSESKPKNFKLSEVFYGDLIKIRRNNISGMLLKDHCSFYFAELPYKTHFTDSFFWKQHLCSNCKMFSAAEWGCPKVRDRYLKLELYPFIETGVEGVNLEKDFTFFVCNCAHHK